MQQLRQLRAHAINLAHDQSTVAPHIQRQIRIFQLHLQHRLHRAQRIPQIVRHARRHLPQHCHPFALRKLSLQPQLVFDQPRQVHHPRQLFCQKFQRRRRLARQIRSGRRRLQHADFLPILHQPHLRRVPQPSRRFQCFQRRIARNRNPHRRQSKFLPYPRLGLGHEMRHLTLTRLLLQLRRQPLYPVHPFRQLPMQERPNRSLQRLKKKNQHKQQHARRSLRRQHRLQPSAHPPHQRQIQQRQKCSRQRIHQIPLRPIFQEIPPHRVIKQQRPWKHA